jgi:type III pantothenate kinase
MLLTVDIGNTNIGLAVFQDDTLVNTWRISSSAARLSDEYGVILRSMLGELKITAAIISSVVIPLTEVFCESIRKYLATEPFVLTHKVKLPFKIALDAPKELGADRIANAAGAACFYELPAIVIDFGTATSFDIVDENKNFLGGLIAPGMEIQAKSLSRFTSKLPNLKLEAPKGAIGKNTIDAMLSGIVCGHACMVDGMLARCERELGKKATIIATGGFSDVLFSTLERKFDYIDKSLTYKGLKYLYELNCGAANG